MIPLTIKNKNKNKNHRKIYRVRNSRRGFALLAVMWVIIIAGMILLGIRKTVHVNMEIARNELESVRARWLARAGLEQALATLAVDDTAMDSAMDYWYSDEDTFDRMKLLRGAVTLWAPDRDARITGSVRFGLIDHASLLNVNVADEKQLKAFCDLNETQINSLLDWRDKDSDARSNGGEAIVYQNLSYPYLIRNAPLQTVAELRLVQEFDNKTYWGEDVNTNGLLDVNENDQDATWPDDDGNGLLRKGLASLCTVYSYEKNRTASGNKRINFNTADKKTLINEFDFSNELADAIVGTGNNKKKKPGNKKQQQRFQSIMKLSDVKAKAKTNNKGSKSKGGKTKKITTKWIAQHFDEITLTDDERIPGKININTASQEVLLSLPEMTDETAQSILSRQTSGKGPFSSVGELLTDKVVSEKQFRAMAERLTVRGNVFEIRSLAITSSGIRHAIKAIVDRNTNPASILYWYQSE